MREVDGGTFLNEPNIGHIVETLRQIFNEGKAKECGAVLTGATVVDVGEWYRRWPRRRWRPRERKPPQAAEGRFYI